MAAPEPGTICDLLMKISEWRIARRERRWKKRNKRLQSFWMIETSRFRPPPPLKKA